jgi:hypothetical protein
LREGRAPESLFRQVSVNVPEEIEMESVSFQDSPMSSISNTVPETPVLDMFINCESNEPVVASVIAVSAIIYSDHGKQN